MSYARFGWEGSDVYVFLSTGGRFECCGCILSDDQWSHDDTDAILAHLRKHQEAGHHVPASTFADIEADREANEAWIAEFRSAE